MTVTIGTTSNPRIPTSLARTEALLERFPGHAESYLAGMWVGDPLADAVVADLGPGRAMRTVRAALADGVDSLDDPPASLVGLFEHVQTPPEWLDLDLLDRTARDVPRYNRQSGIVLGAASLLVGYANPTASRPLEFTGRYVESAGMRTIEVGSWLARAIRVGGLHVGAEGFQRTVRVRMIHALVRQHLLSRPDWDLDAWGVPINQSHLAFTLTEFCLIPLRALAQIGAVYTDTEVEGFYARWRYIGHLLGIDADLLPVDEVDQSRLEAMHLMSRPAPADFCRSLVGGINREFLVPEIEELLPRPAARLAPPVVHGLERLFLGDSIADDLAIPPSRLTPVLRRVGPPLARLNRLLDRPPRLRELRVERGRRYADAQEARLRERYDVRHDMVDDSPDTGVPHPARSQ